MPINLTWLMRNKQPEARAMALQTLHIMRAGGIWDHLGGGLHRYATDRQWRVPHFEKMLYDQAMVAHAALDAYCLTGDQCYREMVENILTFVGRDLSNGQGGFYSALDADSENREGACYLWRREEIETLLGDEADLFCRLYDISETGNFEGGENILHMPLPLDRFSAQEGLDAAELAHRIGQCRSILLTARRARIQPLRDEKIITAWNGLMIAALALWILTKSGGDVDLGGEKHEVAPAGSHAPAASAPSSAACATATASPPTHWKSPRRWLPSCSRIRRWPRRRQ